MKKRGFSLLEILIAIVFFTVGVIAVAWLFTSGLVGSIDAENTTIAMNLAQRKMEEIRNLNFASVAAEIRAEVSDFPGFEREVEERIRNEL